MIACATASVTTSASVTIRLAFLAGSGRKSSAAQNTEISNRSRSASIVSLPDRRIGRLPESAKTLILGVQPFQAAPSERAHHLAVLHELGRVDKHRRVTVALGGVAATVIEPPINVDERDWIQMYHGPLEAPGF